jgi:hypothetical protein
VMLVVNPNHLVRVFYFGLGSAAAAYAYNELRKANWSGVKQVCTGTKCRPDRTVHQQGSAAGPDTVVLPCRWRRPGAPSRQQTSSSSDQSSCLVPRHGLRWRSSGMTS